MDLRRHSEPETRDLAVTIRQLTREPGKLVIDWQDGHQSRFHHVWLRDNCLCEICGDPSSGKKRLRVSQIPSGIAPRSIDLSEAGDVRVVWAPDGHVSFYDADWLRRHCYSKAEREKRCHRPVLWAAEMSESLPQISYLALRSNEAAQLEMLESLRDYGIILVRNVPVIHDEVEKLAGLVGYIRETNFGRVFDILWTPEQKSIANSAEDILPHTDEPYRHQPPGICFFHCVEANPLGGGVSTFVDGFKIAEILRNQDSAAFDLLSRLPQPFRRFYPDEVDVRATGRMIWLDCEGRLQGIRFNDRVAGPLDLPEELVDPFYDAFRKLIQLQSSPEYWCRVLLQPGDAIVFDNHRVLHGRTGFTRAATTRHLRLCHVDRTEFHSRLRILGRRLGRGDDGRALATGAAG